MAAHDLGKCRDRDTLQLTVVAHESRDVLTTKRRVAVARKAPHPAAVERSVELFRADIETKRCAINAAKGSLHLARLGLDACQVMP